jgi:hypothetical protein
MRHVKFFLSVPASVASAEITFSVTKREKNFNRSTMSEERLNGLCILRVNSEGGQMVYFPTIVEESTKNK